MTTPIDRERLKSEVMTLEHLGGLWVTAEDYQALRAALDDAEAIIAFQEAIIEAYKDMLPPPEPDLLRKRLEEIKARKGEG